MKRSRADKASAIRGLVSAAREREHGPALAIAKDQGLRGLQPLAGNRALLALLAAAPGGCAGPHGHRLENVDGGPGRGELRVDGLPILSYRRGAPPVAVSWADSRPELIHLALAKNTASSARQNAWGLVRLARHGITVVPHEGVIPRRYGEPRPVDPSPASQPSIESETRRTASHGDSGEAGAPSLPAIVEPPPADGEPSQPSEREADRVAAVTESPPAEVGPLLPLHERAPSRRARFGPGVPLPPAVRGFFESRFGRSLAGIGIHTGPDAERAAERAGARAFAYGSSIVFNRSEYAPQSREGRQLLAHELTHSIQQLESGAGPVIQRGPKKEEPQQQKVTGVTVYCTDDPFSDSYIVFHTPSKDYTYTLSDCTVPAGSYETTVSVEGAKVHWDFGDKVDGGQEYEFGFKLNPGEQNPATLFKKQTKVHIDVLKKTIFAPPKEQEEEKPENTVADHVAAFKRLVKAAGQARMAANRSALADWRAFLEKQLKPEQVERIAYAQDVQDLQVTAVQEGGQALSAYDEAVTSKNPLRREKAQGQVRGFYRACTGCHLDVLATQLERETPSYLQTGREWEAPVDILNDYAAAEQKSPTPRPTFSKPLKGEGMPPEFRINNPALPGATSASASLTKIQPFLLVLGPKYYDVIPDDLLVTHPEPAAVLAEIVQDIEARRARYALFSNKIGEPDFDYLTLRPIVRELLPLQDEAVQKAIEEEIAIAEDWERVKSVLMFGITIALLLLAIFPPTSAIGIAGVTALEAGMGAYAIYSGLQSIEEGYTLSLGKGARDVLDPEQQEAANQLMVMGAITAVVGALGLKNAAVKGVKLVRGGTAAVTGAINPIDAIEGEAGGNKIAITEISGGNPKVKVTSPEGKVLYEGPLKDMPQEGFGGGNFGSPPKPGANLLQQQRAAAWERLAASKDAQAAELERRVAVMKDAAKAAKFKAQAGTLRNEATSLRQESAEYAAGTRSATADLPTNDEVDAEIDKIAAGKGAPTKGVSIPLGNAERTAADLPRLERGLIKTARGRVVFRVEGSGSRTLLNVDPSGAITTTPGTAYLNFGSLERALEFLAKRGAGARIVAFEVEESWVQSLRSAAVPEGGTKFLQGQPRLVDVRFAEDQMEIPAALLPEMEKFIVPGSAKVVIVK